MTAAHGRHSLAKRREPDEDQAPDECRLVDECVLGGPADSVVGRYRSARFDAARTAPIASLRAQRMQGVVGLDA